MISDPDKLTELRERIEEAGTAEKLARCLGINKGHISKAFNNDYISPILAKAMGWPVTVEVRALGESHTLDLADITAVLKRKRVKQAQTRIRLAADVTEAQRQALKKLASGYGLTWSQLCQELADGKFWPLEPR